MLREALKKSYQTEKEKLKKMNRSEKVSYIWMYYKVPIFVILIVIAGTTGILWNILHNQENDDLSLVHEVTILKNSKLYEIIGKEKIMVNSFHNYHATSNHVYRTVATSSDGQIEALEYPTDTFHLGVQWHPEISYDFDENSRKVIDAFISHAKERRCMRKDSAVVTV